MLSFLRITALGSLLLFSSLSLAQTLEKQRELYQHAEQALKKGKTSEFNRLSEQLKGYVLYPYLEFAQLERKINQLSLSDINTFQTTYDAPYLAERLRTSWLIRQAQARRWNEVNQGYRVSAKPNPILVCHYAHSNLELYPEKSATQEAIRSLWLSVKSQPPACDSLFKSWQQHKQLTPSLIWDKAELAFDANKLKVVQSIRQFLPSYEQKQLDLWMKIHKQPTYITKFPALPDSSIQRRILVDSIKQLFRKHPDTGLKIWPKLQSYYNLTNKEISKLSAYIGLQLAWQHHPEARKWLSAVLEQDNTLPVVEWRLRADIRDNDWKDVIKAYELLPEQAKNDERWIYWKARALEQTGNNEGSRELYESIAKDRHFYGFLASERLGLTPAYNHSDISPDKETMRRVRNSGSIARIKEFNALGRESSARLEWFGTLEHLSDDELMAWSKIAKDNEWHNLAILTIAKSTNHNDLKMRFPMAFNEHVSKNANRHDLDPSMVFALSRQESAFKENVRSPVGAMGLMQLMPRTAQQVSRETGIRYKHSTDVLQPHINIALGTAYFRSLLGSLNNNPILATAAYNAGPHRVAKWLPTTNIEMDQWVESIPFFETRNYVTNVFAYLSIYRHLSGKETKLLEYPKIRTRNMVASLSDAPETMPSLASTDSATAAAPSFTALPKVSTAKKGTVSQKKGAVTKKAKAKPKKKIKKAKSKKVLKTKKPQSTTVGTETPSLPAPVVAQSVAPLTVEATVPAPV